MYHRSMFVVATAVVVTATLVCPALASSQPDARPMPQPALRPLDSFAHGYLKGVAAISKKDVWAVGASLRLRKPPTGLSPLALHWNGARWKATDVPGVNELTAVSAVSPTDVWAVGDDADGSLAIVHWDGNAWSDAAIAPPAGAPGTSLSGLVALADGDMWAVGTSGNAAYSEHWDGASWTVETTPTGGADGSSLSAVTAIGEDDVWTVGISYVDGVPTALADHWNGSVWTNTAVAGIPGRPASTLSGVSGSSSTDVWAVGTSLRGNKHGLVEHWNGTSWSVVDSPNPDTTLTVLNGVQAVAPDDAWAVGLYKVSGSKTAPLTLHWDGSSWSVVSNTITGQGTRCNLLAVAADSASDAWAVGTAGNNGLVGHWNGSTWS